MDSAPTVVQRITNAFRRADEIQWKAGKNRGVTDDVDYFAPVIADAEAGFDGVLNAYELMKLMIEAGAAREAAEVAGTPFCSGRTAANATDLLMSDCDPYHQPFRTDELTAEGFYRVQALSIKPSLVVWLTLPRQICCRLKRWPPCFQEAKKFADAIRAKYPDRLLA